MKAKKFLRKKPAALLTALMLLSATGEAAPDIVDEPFGTNPGTPKFDKPIVEENIPLEGKSDQKQPAEKSQSTEETQPKEEMQPAEEIQPKEEMQLAEEIQPKEETQPKEESQVPEKIQQTPETQPLDKPADDSKIDTSNIDTKAPDTPTVETNEPVPEPYRSQVDATILDYMKQFDGKTIVDIVFEV